MIEDQPLLSLFFSAFISSTLLPGGSELVLLYLATQTVESKLALWMVASIGNSLGGLTSWFLGHYVIKQFPNRSLNEQKHQRVLRYIRRWGVLSLLLSWLPIVGDPLCFVAGWLKLPLWWSALFITLGKSLRYGFLLLVI